MQGSDCGIADFSVAHALALPVLRGCPLLGGAAGLGRCISGVNITDIPDYYNWIHPGELLVTTCFGLRDDPGALTDFIPRLAAEGLAGVCIKPRRYIEKITPEMIAAADALGFPLIALAPSVNFIDISKAIFDLLRPQKRLEHQRNRFLLDLLDSPPSQAPGLEVGARAYGLDPGGWHLVARRSGTPGTLYRPTEEIPPLLPGGVRQACTRRGCSCFDVLDGEQQLLLVTVPPEGDCLEAVLAGLAEGAARMALDPPGHPCCLGVGELHRGLPGLAQSGREARVALAACRATRASAGGLLRFGALGLLGLIYAPDPPAAVAAFVGETIGPLLAPGPKNRELITLLEQYFQWDGNLTRLSQATFIHYNTVSYRLGRIKELTGLDLRVWEDRYRLETALRLHRLLSPEGPPSGTCQ